MLQETKKKLEDRKKTMKQQLENIKSINSINILYNEKDMSTIFNNIESKKKSVYKDYINHGCEINDAMRAGRLKPDRKTNIENKLVPAEHFFKNKQPFYVYRRMTKEYSRNEVGFISTSNVPLKGFGNIQYKVIIMPETKIGMYDITANCNGIERKNRIYEIIISAEQKFEKVSNNGTNYLIPDEYFK